MDIQELQAVLGVYQFRSYFEAAMHLSISPSALSKQIAHVEEELGVKLFERATKGKPAELTDAGRALMKPIQQTVSAYLGVVAQSKSLLENIEYDLNIGYVPSIGTFGEAKLLSGFAIDNPSIHVHLLPDRPLKLLDALKSNAVDALLLTVSDWDLERGGEFANKFYDPDFECMELKRTDMLYLEVSRESELSKLETFSEDNIQLLKDKTILLNSKSSFRHYVERVCKKLKITDVPNILTIDFDKPGVIHTMLLDNPDMLAPVVGTQGKRRHEWINIPVADWNVNSYLYFVALKEGKSKPIRTFRKAVFDFIDYLDTHGEYKLRLLDY